MTIAKVGDLIRIKSIPGITHDDEGQPLLDVSPFHLEYLNVIAEVIESDLRGVETGIWSLYHHDYEIIYQI